MEQEDAKQDTEGSPPLAESNLTQQRSGSSDEPEGSTGVLSFPSEGYGGNFAPVYLEDRQQSQQTSYDFLTSASAHQPQHTSRLTSADESNVCAIESVNTSAAGSQQQQWLPSAGNDPSFGGFSASAENYSGTLSSEAGVDASQQRQVQPNGTVDPFRETLLQQAMIMQQHSEAQVPVNATDLPFSTWDQRQQHAQGTSASASSLSSQHFQYGHLQPQQPPRLQPSGTRDLPQNTTDSQYGSATTSDAFNNLQAPDARTARCESDALSTPISGDSSSSHHLSSNMGMAQAAMQQQLFSGAGTFPQQQQLQGGEGPQPQLVSTRELLQAQQNMAQQQAGLAAAAYSNPDALQQSLTANVGWQQPFVQHHNHHQQQPAFTASDRSPNADGNVSLAELQQQIQQTAQKQMDLQRKLQSQLSALQHLGMVPPSSMQTQQQPQPAGFALPPQQQQHNLASLVAATGWSQQQRQAVLSPQADRDLTTAALASSIVLSEMLPKKEKAPKLSKKEKKDRPKRPLTAYNFFYRDERARLLAERSAELVVDDCDDDGNNDDKDTTSTTTAEANKSTEQGADSSTSSNHHTSEGVKKRRRLKPHGKMGFEEMTMAISKGWSTIDADRKAGYEKLAAEEKRRYREAIAKLASAKKKAARKKPNDKS